MEWEGRKIIELPDDALPSLEELSGDLRLVAEVMEARFPGNGVRIALLLAQALGGTPLRLTNHERYIRRIRDRCIRRDYDTGKYTQVELARKYGICDRQVANVLVQADEDERQMNLFP